MDRNPTNDELPAFVGSIARELAAVRGVIGVVLGGSRARASADANADFDIGIYYRKDDFDWPAVVSLASRWDDTSTPRGFGAPGEWGPWINGGAWLTVLGRPVDFLLRDYDFVGGIVRECLEGHCRSNYQIGHPSAWHNHMIAAEVHHNVILEDAEGALAQLHSMTVPYPETLREEIVRRFTFEARFTAGLLVKAKRRRDAYYVSGLVFRSISCLLQVLYALNRAYFVNEKGSVAGADALPLRLQDLRARIDALVPLAASDFDRGARELTALIDEVSDLARREGFTIPS